MKKYVSYNAEQIDREYRQRKAYAKKQRANCKEKKCYECQYSTICSISNEGKEGEERI